MAEEIKSEETQEEVQTESQDENSSQGNTGITEKDILENEVFKKLLEKEAERESDRKTTSVVKEKQRLEKELDELRKEKMSEKERLDYERSQKDAKDREREAYLNRKEMELNAVELLTEAGLPVGLRKIVVGNTEEETLENIELQKKIIQADRAEQLKKLGRAPVKGSEGSQKNTMTLTEFNNLSANEKTQIALSGVKIVD